MDTLVSKGFNLHWHLSNAFSASVLEASSILYLLDPFFSPKERVAPITGKYCRFTDILLTFLPGWLQFESYNEDSILELAL